MSTDASTDGQDHLDDLGITEQEAGQLLAASGAQEAPEGASQGDETAEEHAGSEAARWRRRLRDSEAEVERLTGRLDTLRRAEVERLAAEHLADGSDLWRHDGIELATLLADDGTVDPELVAEAAKEAVTDRPHWSRNPRQPVPGKPKERLRGGGDPYAMNSAGAKSWSDLLGQR